MLPLVSLASRRLVSGETSWILRCSESAKLIRSWDGSAARRTARSRCSKYIGNAARVRASLKVNAIEWRRPQTTFSSQEARRSWMSLGSFIRSSINQVRLSSLGVHGMRIHVAGADRTSVPVSLT